MGTRTSIRMPATLLFGVVVAVLAVMGSDAVGPVAIIGAILLGAVYVLTGRMAAPEGGRQRARRVRG